MVIASARCASVPAPPDAITGTSTRRVTSASSLLKTLAGLYLFQSGITNFCPPSFLLKKLGFKEEGTVCTR